MAKQWLSTGFKAGAPSGAVDHERGIIEGVSLTTVGEAKGHGVSLDAEFVAEVAAQGAALKQGLKARYGHPNMSSTALGTFIGRFKNFRVDGDQARADLFLSNEASDTPNGDLRGYVLRMADNEPDMFGTSIVFTPGRTYQTAEDGSKEIVEQHAADPERPLYVECHKLHACDAVDEPAANEGLFSAFSKDTLAGQVTEFLDLHPQVFDAITDNPEIIGALAKYGDKADAFFERYKEYRSGNKAKTGDETMSDEKPGVVDGAEVPLEDAAIEQELEAETVETETADNQGEPIAAESEQDEGAESLESGEEDNDSEQSDEVELEAEAESVEQDEDVQDTGIDREEFSRTVAEFGPEIAAQAFGDGGGYDEARDLHYAGLATDNEKLRQDVDTLRGELSAKGGTVSAPSDEPATKRRPFAKM